MEESEFGEFKKFALFCKKKKKKKKKIKKFCLSTWDKIAVFGRVSKIVHHQIISTFRYSMAEKTIKTKTAFSW